MQMTVLHATPNRYLTAILKEGLDPARARDKWGRIWFVREERAEWAIRHVMKKHGITDATQMSVIVCRLDERLLKRNRAALMYHTAHIIRVTPDMIRPARPYLIVG